LIEDMPARSTPYETNEVLDRLEFVPLIEIVASRFIDKKSRSPMELLADSMSSGAFIVGAPIAEWRGVDFGNQKVELAIDGQVVQSVAGSRHASHLLDGVVWLANHLAGRTGGFRAGDVVTTGALKGATPAKTGKRAVGDWGKLGQVEVQFR
jgi:2-keto-4-pentenoate hydratase